MTKKLRVTEDMVIKAHNALRQSCNPGARQRFKDIERCYDHGGMTADQYRREIWLLAREFGYISRVKK
jgi:hypothetical protein